MRATKQRLSLLRTKINEIVPDGNDLYDFPGISKNLILGVIDDSYSIVSLLDDHELAFEVILLERISSEYFEKISKLLKENFQEKKEEFNEFLNLLAAFHFRVKETYITIAKEPIRAEAQIKKTKDELVELKNSLNLIRPIHDELLKIRTDSETIINELTQKNNVAIEKESVINVNFDEIEKLKINAEKAALQIPTWEENIKAFKEDIGVKAVKFEELRTKIESLKSDSETNAEKNKELLKTFEEQLSDNSRFQEQIQRTIEDANRHGMAGSFKITLIILSGKILFDLKPEDLKWERILARLPIFASCVWLGWFCAKQYGFTSRIMEDYSYKYAVSMAFEGYKKATKEVDIELQSKLLELTIFNISNSPLNIYETTTNDGTPYHEFFKNLPKSFTFKKTIGKIEAETKVEP